MILGKEGKDYCRCAFLSARPCRTRSRTAFGLQVTVQGKLTGEGYFLANKVIAKCPSKYEMKERQQRGEKMPHSAMPWKLTGRSQARWRFSQWSVSWSA